VCSSDLGVAMNFGNFDLDFAFNENVLFDGPWILTGPGDGTDREQFAGQISVTYNFGGDDE